MRFEFAIARHSITSQGKFFFRSGHKFFLKAMRLADLGATLDFSEKLRLRRRLEELKGAHTSSLILTEAQSQPAMDVIAAAAMIALVELQVTPADLEDGPTFGTLVSRFAHTANVNRSHAALAGYLIDCPVTEADYAQIGAARIRRRLGHLVRILKRHDESVLVAIKHSAETLDWALLEEDFLYVEAPLMELSVLRNLMLRMHRQAGARPTVIEFTVPSPGQDEAVAVAFGTGGAGVVAPPVPAPASREWLGLRALRQSDQLPFVSLNGCCPPQAKSAPKVSVVVCAHNAERVITQCLESLVRLEYPDYEVIVVDDGSNDRTDEIARKFPQFRLLRQSNLGLSAARDAGLKAARGGIVAYLKPDCIADPHWLAYLIRTMEEEGLDACAGPVYPAQDATLLAKCAGGINGPLPGQNLSFRKQALTRVGGFDRIFTRDGGEIDLGWRMDDAKMSSGYSPAAVVWRTGGGSMRHYLKRQADYAHGEAILSECNPERFSFLGLNSYPALTIGQGEPVPRMPGWMLFWFAAALLLAIKGLTLIPIFGFLLAMAVFAVADARHAMLPNRLSGFAPRMLAAMLTTIGPVWRCAVVQRVRLQLRNSRSSAKLHSDRVGQAPVHNQRENRALARNGRGTALASDSKTAVRATRNLSVSH